MCRNCVQVPLASAPLVSPRWSLLHPLCSLGVAIPWTESPGPGGVGSRGGGSEDGWLGGWVKPGMCAHLRNGVEGIWVVVL